VLEELKSEDWAEVFKYALGDKVSQCVGDLEVAVNGFTRNDVVTILHATEGENDGPNWEALGFVRDGRWFYISAGCDYTGWG